MWKSTDAGDSWEHMGLDATGRISRVIVHPTNPDIVYVASLGHAYAPQPERGIYRTTDGGESWDLFSHNAVATNPGATKELAALAARSGGEAASALPPDKDPAGLDELHKMRLDPKNPDRIWGQAHWGVFRSDDRGATWQDVTSGLPSFHGFPIAVSRCEPDGVYVVPLDYGQDNFRVSRGKFTVYRTRDGAQTWEPLTAGLPGPQSYQSVYREGLDTDGLDPEGVYVGTSNGQVFASADGGDHWQRLPGDLPPVLSISCAVT